MHDARRRKADSVTRAERVSAPRVYERGMRIRTDGKFAYREERHYLGKPVRVLSAVHLIVRTGATNREDEWYCRVLVASG